MEYEKSRNSCLSGSTLADKQIEGNTTLAETKLSCRQDILKQESIHVRAAKIIINLEWCTSSRSVLVIVKWNTLETTYEKRLLILAHQAYYNLLPYPMSCLFVKYESRYDFRRKMTFRLPRPRTHMIKKACSYVHNFPSILDFVTN